MDEVYKTISRAINIDSNREKYTKMYNYVRDTFLNALRENEIFKVLFCDVKLSGSYADNLKISKPNEFDLVMQLKLPFDDLVKIYPDGVNVGSVFINLSDVLKRLEETKNLTMSKFLQGMVNKKGFFLLNKFQSWLEGRFEIFLTKIDRVLTCNGEICNLEYKKNGPAHTIYVSNGKEEFAIDFVPGFRFADKLSVSKRKPTAGYWDAIPRPYYDTNNNTSFKSSFADSEREIIANKYQFKNTLRLMKKFRDMNPKLGEIKSYFIKTLFLWHAEDVGSGFWMKESITQILHVMFEKLENALKDKEIKWYWNKKVNLLQSLKPTQIESMYHEVKNRRKILLAQRSSKDILSIFLTEKELGSMPAVDRAVVEAGFTETAPVQAIVTKEKQCKMPVEEKKVIQADSRKTTPVQAIVTKEKQRKLPTEDKKVIQPDCTETPTVAIIAGAALVAAGAYALYRYLRPEPKPRGSTD